MSNIKAKKEIDWQDVQVISEQINKLLDIQKANDNDLFYRVHSDLEDAQRKIEELEQHIKNLMMLTNAKPVTQK